MEPQGSSRLVYLRGVWGEKKKSKKKLLATGFGNGVEEGGRLPAGPSSSSSSSGQKLKDSAVTATG